MAKGYRRYVVIRNKQYETHQLDSRRGQLVKVSDISDNDWKRRKLRQKHLVSGKRIWSIKSIALIFMIEM